MSLFPPPTMYEQPMKRTTCGACQGSLIWWPTPGADEVMPAYVAAWIVDHRPCKRILEPAA